MRSETRYNPLLWAEDEIYQDVAEGTTPNELVVLESIDLRLPTVLVVDGTPWKRARWDEPIPEGAVVEFVRLPAGGGGSDIGRILAMIGILAAAAFIPGLLGLAGTTIGSAISAGIMLGGSIAANLFFGGKKSNSSSSQQQTFDIDVYSLSSNNNAVRIGQPIPEHFGRCIVYPDMIQGAYLEIDGATQDHYLYFLGVIGVGFYDLTGGVYVNKTPIGQYADSTFEIVQPGGQSTLVPNLVWTSAEFNGQELEVEPIYGIINPTNTVINEIGYDVIFPAGLGSYTATGLPWPYYVSVGVGVRLVDEYGDPLSDWVLAHTFTYGMIPYYYPLRFSWKFPAPLGPGRYEMYIHRSQVATDGRTIDRCTVGNVRGYGDPHPNYGDVTLLACKIKATNTLTGEVASKLNVIATRYLPIVTETGLQTPYQPTRSIVDAVAYMVTAENMGRQPASSLDYPSLANLKARLDAAGHYFDWRFTSRSTVMECMTTAAMCGRCMPYMPGGIVTLERDEWRASPAAKFTDADYTAGTFRLTPGFRTADDPTCYEVTYTDPKDWQAKSVLCYGPGGSEENPEEVKLEGCTSRDQAYSYGLHLWYRDCLGRTTVEFQTGFKGRLPAIGDHILCAVPWADWGQTGVIAAIRPEGVYTSEPLDFSDSATGWMYLTLADGSLGGPYGVTPTEDAHCVLVALPEGLVVSQEEDHAMATRYVFGPRTSQLVRARVVSTVPVGSTEVRIVGNLAVPEMYPGDGVAPPAPPGAGQGPALAVVMLQYRGKEDGQYQFFASWGGSAPTFRLEVNQGAGYVVVADNAALYGQSILSSSRTVTVRVTPYVGGVLQSGSAKTASYEVMPAPDNLRLVSIGGDGLSLAWDAVVGAAGYAVSLWDDGVELDTSRRFLTAATTQTYTADELTLIASQGLGAVFEARVVALADGNESDAAVLAITAPLLAVPGNVAVAGQLETGVILGWDPVPNATGYVVYHSVGGDFDPATEGTLVYTGSARTATITGLDMDLGHTFKVAATNLFFQAAGELSFATLYVGSGAPPVTPPATEDFAVVAWGNAGLAEHLPSYLRAVWTDCAVKDTSSGTGYGVAVLLDGTVQMWGDIPTGLTNWSSLSGVAKAWVQYGGMVYLTTDGALRSMGAVPSAIANGMAGITNAEHVWWPRVYGTQATNMLVQRTDGSLVGIGNVLVSHYPPVGMAYPLRSVALGGTDSYPVAVAVDATGKLWAWGVEQSTGKLITQLPTVTNGIAVFMTEGQDYGPGIVIRADGTIVYWGYGATSSYWASFRAIPAGFTPDWMMSLGPAASSSTSYPAYSGGMGINESGVMQVWGGSELTAQLPVPDGVLAVQARGFAHNQSAGRRYGAVALRQNSEGKALLTNTLEVLLTNNDETLEYQ